MDMRKKRMQFLRERIESDETYLELFGDEIPDDDRDMVETRIHYDKEELAFLTGK